MNTSKSRGGCEQSGYEDLVARIRAGDKRAEADFCARFRDGLVIMMRQRTQDDARAEDLVHESLITVLKRLRDTGIEHPHLLNRFVQQTAKYVFIGWTRRPVNHVAGVEDLDGLVIDPSDVEEDVIREETRHAVRDVIDAMPIARDRDIMYRYYVRDESKKMICEALGLSGVHFDRVISRARDRFRTLYEREDHGGATKFS